MKNIYLPSKFLAHLLIFTVPLMLNVWGGSVSTSLDNIESTFSGSVGDGPIVGATVKFYDKNHKLVGTSVSNTDATYSTKITTRTIDFPIAIKVEDGFDLVTGMEPDFRLLSTISDHSVKDTNTNPFSTMIVTASYVASGGMSEASLSTARAAVMSQMNFGLDPLIISDPISTPVTNSNVALITKSSEAMGEMIRRIRDHMNSSGANIDGNDVVVALAADISDGVIDGVGGQLTNPRISALSKLVSAQVLVEALSNNLKVQGEIATSRLDNAIMDTHPTVGFGQLTASVKINGEMLEQARAALYAAQVLDPGNELNRLADILNLIPAGSLPAEIERRLPADSGDYYLGPVINYALSATNAELELVNTADISQKHVNSAPQLSGNPPSSLLEGSTYLFHPNARDTDGDVLVFSISNKPAWASFDSANGRLTGTPGAYDLGYYGNIVLSVSDGLATDSIGPFSISVMAINHAPTISGNAPSSVNEGVAYSFTPSASDPDGDSLVFRLSGQPSLASFYSSTSRLSGTPVESDAGTHSNIVTSVSDGAVTTSLPTFSSQVGVASPPAETGPGSFTLSWTDPISRTDDTPLLSSEIVGYTVYYGTSPGYYTSSIDVAYPDQTVTVGNLPAGTYYVVITTRDIDGRESTYSQEIIMDVL